MDEFLSIIGDPESEDTKFNDVDSVFIKFNRLPKKLNINSILNFLQSQTENLEFFSLIPTTKGNYICIGFSKPGIGRFLTSLFVMLSKNKLEFCFCPSKKRWRETKHICERTVQQILGTNAPISELKPDEESEDVPMPDEDLSIPADNGFSDDYDLDIQIQQPQELIIDIKEEEQPKPEETKATNNISAEPIEIPQPTVKPDLPKIDFWKNIEDAVWEPKLEKHFIDMNEIEKKIDLFPDSITVLENSPYSIYKARNKAIERQMPILDENQIQEIISYKSLFDV